MPPCYMRLRFLAMSLILLLINTFSTQVAAVIYVSTSGADNRSGTSTANAVRTITRAAALAATTDSILIMNSGTFAANLQGIDKTLTITGNGGVRYTLSFDQTNTFVIENSPNSRVITIDNFQIQQSSSAPTSGLGLLHLNNTNVVLRNVYMTTAVTAEQIISINNSTLTASNFRLFSQNLGFLTYGILIDGSRSNVTFTDSSFTYLLDGNVFRINEGSLSIQNSVVSDSGAKFIVARGGATEFRNTTFDRMNGIGIYTYDGLYVAASISVVGCKFRNLTLGEPVIFTIGGNPYFGGTTFVQITDSEFTNIDSGFQAGGAIGLYRVTGSVLIARCNFTRVTSRGFLLGIIRGAVTISTYSPNVVIRDSTFTSCGTPTHFGGALSVYESAATPGRGVAIENCVFRNNSASDGGAVFLDGLTNVTISGCTFENNTATAVGGAVAFGFIEDIRSNISILSSTFKNNRVLNTYLSGSIVSSTRERQIIAAGGAISLMASFDSITISNSSFTTNSVSGVGWAEGGAVKIALPFELGGDGHIRVLSSTFVGNTVSGREPTYGGALSLSGDSISAEVTGSRFIGNAAVWNGLSTIFDNRLALGGALSLIGDPTSMYSSRLLLQHSQFLFNSASQGGAISIQQSALTTNNVTIRSNFAAWASGGIVYISSQLFQRLPVDLVLLKNTTFDTNIATIHGEIPNKNQTCSGRGVQPQSQLDLSCDQCSFVNTATGTQAPLGSHFALLGGGWSLLQSPARARVMPAITRCDFPLSDRVCPNSIELRPLLVTVTNDLEGIDVIFAETILPSNFAPSVVPGSCEGLLTLGTLTQVGWNRGSSTCKLNSEGNIIQIRSISLPFPANIQFVGSSIVAVNGFKDIALSIFDVQAPEKPAASVVRVSATPESLPCSSTFASSAASSLPGVFPRTSSWSVFFVGATEVGLQQFISFVGEIKAFSIPDSVWDVSNQNRSVVLRFTSASVFEAPVFSSATIKRVGDPTPVVFPEGPLVRNQFSAYELQLNARVEVPLCLKARSVSVSRSWTLASGTPTSELSILSSWQGQTLFIPPRALLPSQQYVFRFTARVEGAANLQSSFDLTVNSIGTPLQAYFSRGGGLVSVYDNVPFQITVVDQDDSTATTVYAWNVSCVASSNETLVVPDSYPLPFHFPTPRCQQCFSILLARDSTQTVSANQLPAGLYSVAVAVGRDVRAAEISALTNFTIAPAGTILPLVLIPRWPGPRPSARERIAVAATVNGSAVLAPGYYVEWVVLNTSFASDQYITTPLNALNIAFKPDVFAAGKAYTLQLSVFRSADNSLAGRNWLTLPINASPRSGFVTVTPLRLSQFEPIGIASASWVDEDLPLRYSYSLLLSNGTDDELYLTDVTDIDKISVPISISGNVTVRARIIDSIGAETIVDTPIMVYPAPTLLNVTDLLEEFKSLVLIGDLRRAAGVVSLLLRNQPSVSIQREVTKSLQDFARQIRFTARNARFVLRTARSTSRDSLQDSFSRANFIDVVCSIIEAAHNSSLFGSSSASLFTLQNLEGFGSLRDISEAFAIVLSSINSNVSQFVTTDQALRLKSSAEKLTGIMSRAAVVNEVEARTSADLFEALSFIRCGSSAYNLTISGTVANLVPVSPIDCVAGRVSIEAVLWSEGRYPVPIIYNSTVTSTTPIFIVSTAPVLTVGMRWLEVSWNNYTAGFPFLNLQAPAGAPSSTPTSCVQLHPQTQTWTTQNCRLEQTAASSYICYCSPITSSTTTVTLSIAFGDVVDRSSISITNVPTPTAGAPTPMAYNAPDGTPIEAPPVQASINQPQSTSGGGGATTADSGLGTGGIAGIAAASAVIAIGAVIFALVWMWHRKKTFKKHSLRVRRQLSKSTESPPSTAETKD